MGERADAMRNYGEPPEYVRQATERDLDVAASDITPTTSDDPEAIRENIEQTRAEMSTTIDAIQKKLDPDRLKAQVSDAVHEQVDAVKERVREATIGRAERMVSDFGDSARDAGSGFLGTIKDNPIPAAMAALGIAWLWAKRRNGSSDHSYDYRGGRYAFEAQGRPYGYGMNYTASGYGPYPSGRDYYGVPGGYRGGYQGGYQGGYDERPGAYQGSYQGSDDQSLRDLAGNAVGQAKETVGDVASQTRDRVSGVAGTAQEKAGQFAEQTQERVGEFADTAQERFGEWSDQAQYGMRRAKTRFDQTLDENPLAVSAAAIALGLAVGMSIPDTPWEDRLMGETRDSVVEKAQSAAQETMQKVQTVVGQVQDTAKDAAKDAAMQVKQTAQQEAQKQGLVSGDQQQGRQGQQRAGQQSGTQQSGNQQRAGQSGSSSTGGQPRSQSPGTSAGISQTSTPPGAASSTPHYSQPPTSTGSTTP